MTDLYIAPAQEPDKFNIFPRSRKGGAWCAAKLVKSPMQAYYSTTDEGRMEVVLLATNDGLTIEQP